MRILSSRKCMGSVGTAERTGGVDCNRRTGALYSGGLVDRAGDGSPVQAR